MHRHESIEGKTSTIPFVGRSVSPKDPNPKAHGGVTYIQVCKCGMTRMINSGGVGKKEFGEWTKEGGPLTGRLKGR